MNREVHVRICGGRRVKLPPPTRRRRERCGKGALDASGGGEGDDHCLRVESIEVTSEPVVNTNVGGGSGGYRIRRLRCCTRDGGWLALRSLPAGGGFKAPCAAAVTAVGGERHGKGALAAGQLGTGKKASRSSCGARSPLSHR